MTTFASMEKATQYELRLAERMSRLGTETAFEVLNKARALERQGKDIVHLEIGEPDFDTPKDIVEAGVEALQSWMDALWPIRGTAGIAPGRRGRRRAQPRSQSYERLGGCCPRRQAHYFLYDSGVSGCWK